MAIAELGWAEQASLGNAQSPRGLEPSLSLSRARALALGVGLICFPSHRVAFCRCESNILTYVRSVRTGQTVPLSEWRIEYIRMSGGVCGAMKTGDRAGGAN